MNNKNIGRYIQTKRKEYGLTQKELASKLSVSEKTISKWERSICLPDVSYFDEICSIFNITMVELLKGEDIDKEKQMDLSENELKGSLIYKYKITNIFKIVSYIFMFAGFLFFLISNIKNGPYKIFDMNYILYFGISVFGFILLMYQNSKSLFDKIFKTILFIFSYFIIGFIVLILNFYILINPNRYKSLDRYYYATVPKEFSNKSYDEIIESGNISFYDYDSFKIISYDTGLPFIKPILKLCDYNNRTVKLIYGDYYFDENVHLKIDKVIKEKYDIDSEFNYFLFFNERLLFNIEYYKYEDTNESLFIFDTKDYYYVYKGRSEYVNKYLKSDFKDSNDLAKEFIKLYPSKYEDDMYRVFIRKTSKELLYDYNYNIVYERSF